MVRVRRATESTPTERAVARRALLELRFGLEAREARTVETARAIRETLFGTGSDGGRAFDASLGAGSAVEDLIKLLERELELGRLTIERTAPQVLDLEEEVPPPDLPPAPPPLRESGDTFFEVRFLDEIGRAIAGVALEFDISGDPRGVPTNAGGVALAEGVRASTAAVEVEDTVALERLLEPRWRTFRPGAPPTGSNLVRFVFAGGELAPVPLKAAVPHTVVLQPPLGKLFVQLFDKTGRVRHANRPYTIDGPMQFEGTTDDEGRLLHLEVLRGDYTLTFEVEVDAGDGPEIDEYETPIIVLEPDETDAEVRMLGAVPRSVLARMRFLFNTNKAFLLPTAIPDVRALRELYFDNSPTDLLIVGHADTTAGPEVNDKLSLTRAQSILAYLQDDVDAWLEFYATSVPEKQRWGKPEDRMMILSLPDFETKPKGEDAVRFFQRTRNLTVDGIAGPQTRTQLIKEYMDLDGTSMESAGFSVEATVHGCGENFPLDESGDEVDTAPEDEKRDPTDRRVELYFFDREFGIIPTPPGENSAAGSPEYPEWRKRAVEVRLFEAAALQAPEVVFVEIADALFRTNSAVVLPEGETPTQDSEELEALTSVGAFAAILRFNAEHEGRTFLVAGHADTTNTVDFNQTLSEERARCTLSLLLGQREEFKTLCDERHTVGDYKEILAWVSRAFPDLVFDCDPGTIDDIEETGVEPVRAFQNAYNTNKAALGTTANDLDPDGDVGPLTWGAFFDCYELALRRELGEDAAGVSALRDLLVPVDPDNQAIGFSEHFPIEELGVDNFRSQSNRRAEIQLFEQGEEPDVPGAIEEPESADLYLPGRFERIPLELDNARRGATVDFIGARGTTRFSANSDFPKPSLLAFVKAIQARLDDDATLDVLLIGHADDVNVDQSAAALSLSRADTVRAWMTGDDATLLAKFTAGGASRNWGFEEIQWMLQSVTLADLPCYIDRVDGYPGPNTLRALEYFQVAEELPITGLADDATLALLVQRYVELADTPADAGRVLTVGAGSVAEPAAFGKSTDPVFPDDAPQRRRRVEAILFPPPLNPAQTGLAADPTIYAQWCRRVVEVLEIVDDRPTFLALTDDAGEFLEAAGFDLLESDEAGNLVPAASGTTDEQGIGSAVLKEGRYVVRAAELEGVVEVSHDEFGGQMLVVLSPEEPEEEEET